MPAVSPWRQSSSSFSNPYIDEAIALGIDLNTVNFESEHEVVRNRIDIFEVRTKLSAKYAWAVPSREAIRFLASFSPVVEIGAGTGYWASLVQTMGGKITPYDSNPPLSGTNKFGHKVEYTTVYNGGIKDLQYHKDDTLFLCWPPYNTLMAYYAVHYYQGDRIVFVGESDGGCCGNDKFFQRLEKEFYVTQTLDIPHWPYIHDRMFVYTRIGSRLWYEQPDEAIQTSPNTLGPFA